jgi:hypothetical protein
VSAGKLLAGSRIEQRDLRIDRLAQPPAKDFEADALTGLHMNSVIVARLRIHLAHDHARNPKRLGGRARLVAARFHDLG